MEITDKLSFVRLLMEVLKYGSKNPFETHGF